MSELGWGHSMLERLLVSGYDLQSRVHAELWRKDLSMMGSKCSESHEEWAVQYQDLRVAGYECVPSARLFGSKVFDVRVGADELGQAATYIVD